LFWEFNALEKKKILKCEKFYFGSDLQQYLDLQNSFYKNFIFGDIDSVAGKSLFGTTLHGA